jgi:hypothetical protein
MNIVSCPGLFGKAVKSNVRGDSLEDLTTIFRLKNITEESFASLWGHV